MINRVITGKLIARTGLHIGSGNFSETTDLPVFRNANREIIIPGTVIAGALRSMATKISPYIGMSPCILLDSNHKEDVCKCNVCELFGSIYQGDKSNEGSSSKVWVYDAVLDGEVISAIRDGVGIDRETGASAQQSRAKFDYEVIPRGSKFIFRIHLEKDVPKEQEILLAFVLSEWVQGRCFIGGNAARGLGNMQLKDLDISILDLNSRENLMSYLLDDEPRKFLKREKDWFNDRIDEGRATVKQSSNVGGLYQAFFQIDMEMIFTGPFIVNDSVQSAFSGFEFCPKIENGKFILPGSAIRGILRSHAEKIARTLVTLNSNGQDDFLSACPACNPLAGLDYPLSSCHVLLRDSDQNDQPGKLCLACQLFGSALRGSSLYVSDGELVSNPRIKIMDFVAIDRFTGGAKEGSKFDAVALWQPRFKLRIFIEDPEDWQLGWLMLAIKDMSEGLIPIGFGKNRGFGSYKIKQSIKIGAVSKQSFLYKLIKPDCWDGIFQVDIWQPEQLADREDGGIESWVNAFHKKLKDFKRDSDAIPDRDTYFREDILALYPKEVRV